VDSHNNDFLFRWTGCFNPKASCLLVETYTTLNAQLFGHSCLAHRSVQTMINIYTKGKQNAEHKEHQMNEYKLQILSSQLNLLFLFCSPPPYHLPQKAKTPSSHSSLLGILISLLLIGILLLRPHESTKTS